MLDILIQHQVLDYFIQYNGVDWVAMVVTVFALYYLGNKQRVGFLLGVASAILWLIFNVMIESAAGILANAIFAVLQLRGYWKWHSASPAA